MSKSLASKRKIHPYYNYDKLYSLNGTFNFVVGPRGNGKTFGKKIKDIRKWIATGEQFIYLRRYKTEITAARNTFFADLTGEFPEWDFRTNGNIAQAARVETRDEKKRLWHTMGYFIALSTAQTQKSVSFPLVTSITFDEFIIEKGSLHYLPNEADVFQNFYSTVDRNQDKTRAFFLANSVSIDNPYFLKYGIRPDELNEFVKLYKGYIVCHFIQSEAFSTSVYATKFGQFIQGTEYADFAIGAEFADNGRELVEGKNSTAEYLFTLETLKGYFSVWRTPFEDTYYLQRKRPKSENLFTMLPSRMSSEKRLMLPNDKPLKFLRTAFGSARVYFDEPSTRNAFTEIFKR